LPYSVYLCVHVVKAFAVETGGTKAGIRNHLQSQ
jgi:hypothetical protein